MTEIKQFAAAFIKAQQMMSNATKDSKNPFFKSKYADLNSVREACLPALNENGIAVMQPIVQVENKSFVKTLLLHESGESMECLTEIIFNKQNDAQAQGSGITYARRYGLQSLVNIGSEDDDGNKASEGKSRRNSFGLNPNSDLASGEDMKKTQEESNIQLADRLIARINSMGSVEELEGWLEEKPVKSAYIKLEKYLLDKFNEVKKAELAMFNELDPAGEE